MPCQREDFFVGNSRIHGSAGQDIVNPHEVGNVKSGVPCQREDSLVGNARIHGSAEHEPPPSPTIEGEAEDVSHASGDRMGAVLSDTSAGWAVVSSRDTATDRAENSLDFGNPFANAFDRVSDCGVSYLVLPSKHLPREPSSRLTGRC